MQQHLIIDADDTLWENNIYFERAFDEFVEFLAHSTMAPQQVRDVLDDAKIPIVGEDTGSDYGRSVFLYVLSGRVEVRSLRKGSRVL